MKTKEDWQVLGQLRQSKHGENKSYDCHQISHHGHPSATGVADRDALVGEVLVLLDEEEEGLGVVLDQVVAGEVAALLELLQDGLLAGERADTLETARLEVATGEMSELIPTVFHTRWLNLEGIIVSGVVSAVSNGGLPHAISLRQSCLCDIPALHLSILRYGRGRSDNENKNKSPNQG